MTSYQDQKRILLIATGGTIGSEKSEAGVKPKYPASYQLGFVNREIRDRAHVDTMDLMSYDSTNIMYTDRVALTKEIASAYSKRYNAVVVTHGTDKMVETVAHVTFHMFPKKTPVIFTGSRTEMDAEGSNGPANINGAFMAALRRGLVGEYVFYDGQLMRGIRASKVTNPKPKQPEIRAETFTSLNYPNLYRRSGKRLMSWRAAGDYERRFRERMEFLSDGMREPVAFEQAPKTIAQRYGMKKLYTDMPLGELFNFAKDKWGVILEGWGSGNIPDREEANYIDAVHELVKQGKVVVMESRVQGLKAEPLYELAVKALRAGAVMAFDIDTDRELQKMQLCYGILEAQRERRWFEKMPMFYSQPDPDQMIRMLYYNFFDEVFPDFDDMVKYVDVKDLKISDREVQEMMRRAYMPLAV